MYSETTPLVISDSAAPACEPMPEAVRILRERVIAAIVGLNLRDNTVCVYHGERRVVKEARTWWKPSNSPLPHEPVESEDLASVAGVRNPRRKGGQQRSTRTPQA